jgi:hypothetical protein
MEIKKQPKKSAKTLPLKNLPVVPLNEFDMFSVSGGSYGSWSG